jgi:hypothetical protein
MNDRQNETGDPLADEADWQNLRLGLSTLWRRNPNLALRKLRDYVGYGDDSERVARVHSYFRSEEFPIEEKNDQTEALRKFCARRFARQAAARAV